MDAREARGLEIAAKAKIKRSGTVWVVPSLNSGNRYIVSPDEKEPHCTCPDFEFRQCACKHVFAVRIVIEREQHADGTETVTETVELTSKKTYRQNWPAYNAAQTTEKHSFQQLLHDLCSGVEDHQEPRRGRPRLPLQDAVFACVFKVYSTVSGRRFISDLKDAHERGFISCLPHYNSIFNYLEDERMTDVLKSMVQLSGLPLASVETHFAADASGFACSRFERWFDIKYGVERKRHKWVKCHIMCGVNTNVVTAVEIAEPTTNDSIMFPPLLRTTVKNFNVQEVSADMGYLSRGNVNRIAAHGALPFIPFKSNSKSGPTEPVIWRKMWHWFHLQKESFLANYHKRSNVESTFSMVKAKFRDSVRSKTETAMNNEVLCKFLCHNICCVISAIHELGISPEFWPAAVG